MKSKSTGEQNRPASKKKKKNKRGNMKFWSKYRIINRRCSSVLENRFADGLNTPSTRISRTRIYQSVNLNRIMSIATFLG